MTDDELATIEQRLQDLPDGRWVPMIGMVAGPPAPDKVVCRVAVEFQVWMAGVDDVRRAPHAITRFIAAARQDVPTLIAEVRRLRQALYDQQHCDCGRHVGKSSCSVCDNDE